MINTRTVAWFSGAEELLVNWARREPAEQMLFLMWKDLVGLFKLRMLYNSVIQKGCYQPMPMIMCEVHISGWQRGLGTLCSYWHQSVAELPQRWIYNCWKHGGFPLSFNTVVALLSNFAQKYLEFTAIQKINVGSGKYHCLQYLFH